MFSTARSLAVSSVLYALSWPLSGVLLDSDLGAQTEWRHRGGVAEHAMAYDSARVQFVRFGGAADDTLLGSTWVGDSQGNWTEVQASQAPAPRRAHRMVYADHLGYTLLFGGFGETSRLNDLWTWDGTTWSVLSTSGGPGPRSHHAMAYDPVRQRIVLFGGRVWSSPIDPQAGLLDETWEFDGVTWTLLDPVHRPPASGAQGALAFNPVTQRVAFYDWSSTTTWEWDGQDWINLSPATAIHAGWGSKLVTDPAGQGVLAIGGDDASQGTITAGEFALWDGTDWTRLATRGDAARRSFHAAATAGRLVVVHGGSVREEDSFTRTSATQVWDGAAWSIVAPDPLSRSQSAMTFDRERGEMVLLGGRRGFFSVFASEVRGAQGWSPLQGAPDLFGMAVAHDDARGETVAFGGCDFRISIPCELTSDRMWRLSGANWIELQPAHRPSPRHAPAMADDPSLQQVVLFGGYDPQQGVLADTWLWDGTDWTELLGAGAPPAAGPMTYDPLLGGVAMAAGSELWLLRSDFGGPLRWRRATLRTFVDAVGLCFDESRNRLVWLDRVQGTWELDAHTSQWVYRAGPAKGDVAAYDPVRRAVLVFGPDGLWEYGPVFGATWSAIGAGCAGSQGAIPEVVPERDAWVGDIWPVRVEGLPTGTSGSAPVVLGCIGFDNTAWNGMPLPLSLASVGMPGCFLYQDVSRIDLLAGSTWSIPIPPRAELIGIDVFLQAWTLDPAANAGGATTSSSVRATLGSL